MAIVNDNLITKGLSGGLGKKTLVFRQVRGRTIVATSPTTSDNPTEAQKAQRERFSDAVDFAKSQMRDSYSRSFYEQEAKRRKQPNGYNVAIADFFGTPEILTMNENEYVGQIGNKIYVTVTDDVSIASVKVELLAADGSVVESGGAVQKEFGSSVWIFTAATQNPSWDNGKIKVTAYDRPGNTAVKEITRGAA